MRFIQKWSYACAYKLAIKLNDNHQKRSVYYFGFQIFIGAIVKGLILFSTALLLGMLLPVILISFTFASLRVFAGGYHMDTYGRCIAVSLVFFLVAGLTAQYTYSYWNSAHIVLLIAVTFIIGLYAVIRYAPKDTPNKPITEPEEIRKFKRLSIICIFVWIIVVTILGLFGMNMYVLSICFGVLLELFSITPTGHKFFDSIKSKLT